MLCNHRFALAVIAVVSFEYTTAFSPVPATPIITCKPSSATMQLVPEQGRQLVAYSQAALAKKAKESASKASNLVSDRRRSESSPNEGLTKARNLMTRLLHLSPTNAGAEDLYAYRERTLHDQLSSFYQEESEDST